MPFDTDSILTDEEKQFFLNEADKKAIKEKPEIALSILVNELEQVSAADRLDVFEYKVLPALVEASTTRRILYEQRIAEALNTEAKDIKAAVKEAVNRKKKSTVKPRGKPAVSPDSEDFNLTDLGNAERMIHQNNGNIRYCPELKLFLVWNGKHWRRDTDGEIVRLAAKTVRSLYNAANSNNPFEQAEWAKESESRSRLNAMCDLAKSLEGVPISINELDQQKYYINCLSGTIDLKTRKLLKHSKAHNLTHLLPFEYKPYDSNCDCKRWVQFLCEITGDNLDLMRYLWKLAGLCLSGDTSEHILNIFYGSRGRNGKGVFLGTIQAILGDLQCGLPFACFEPKNAGSIPNDIARMAGKRLVIAQESNEGRRLDEAVIKTLTGDDMLTGRFLRAEYFDFKPTHKIVMTTNNKPVIRETSNAIWSRLRLIPFEVSFQGREDKQLKEKLQEELPQIFAWMIDGFSVWQEEGLKPPQCVADACKEYRAAEDTVQIFIDECCYINENVSVSAKSLYDSFINWAAKNGEKAISRRVFIDRIRQRNFRDYTGMGILKFKGIGLLDFKQVSDKGIS